MALKGNKHALGNKGGGRHTQKEERWHLEKWNEKTDVAALKALLATGKYAVRDAFLAKALQGDVKVLSIFANKILADLHELSGAGGGPIEISWLSKPDDEL